MHAIAAATMLRLWHVVGGFLQDHYKYLYSSLFFITFPSRRHRRLLFNTFCFEQDKKLCSISSPDVVNVKAYLRRLPPITFFRNPSLKSLESFVLFRSSAVAAVVLCCRFVFQKKGTNLRLLRVT